MDSFDSRNDFADSNTGDMASETQGASRQAGGAPAVEARNGVVILQPDANGLVVLPEGASLDDLTVQGRDLVIVMEDGTRIVIPEGAIIVPQIVVDGVTVPAANLAALLTGNEPQPAAGDPQSSGGNFEVDPGNIQAAYAIGDLLPYTELQFPQPEEREIIPYRVEEDPVIVVETPDNPAGAINAIATVDEDGLPARTIDGVDETAGTRDETNSEVSVGTIRFSAPDGVDIVSVNGVNIIENGEPALALNSTITGDNGFLTITSINVGSGEIGFFFTLTDNLVGETVDGSFVMTVVDVDGDSSTANLQINVIDDNPIARDDVDEVAGGSFAEIDGNVLVNDEPGADGYRAGGAVTGYSNANGSVQPGQVLVGQYGELTIDAQGNYTYQRYFETPGDVVDVFNYSILDGDGTPSNATLTIEIGNAPPVITNIPTGEDATVVEEDQLPPTTGTRDGESEGSEFDGDSETATGTITFTSLDGVGSITIGGVVLTGEFLADPTNFPFDVVTDDTGTLTITGYTYVPETGQGTITYVYTLTDNTSDPETTTVTFPIVVTDLDGDPAPGDLVITIVDDTPEANDDALISVAEDFAGTIGGNVMDNDVEGADGATVTAITVGEVTVAVPQDGTYAELVTDNGTYRINFEGDWTFDPNPGLDQSEGAIDATFTYTISEGEGGDGDADTAVQPILITDGAAPANPSPVTVTLDDQNLADGSTPAAPEQDAGVLAFTEGSDAFESFAFATDLSTLGGNLTWTRLDGDTIIGEDNGRLVVTLQLTVSGNNATVTATLEDNYLGHSSQGDELDDLGFVNVIATDIDGDTATGRVDINVSDDVPAANDDALVSVAEDVAGTVGGNVMANDVEGADGATVTAITVGEVTVAVPQDGSTAELVTGNGTYTIDYLGNWTFDPNPGLDQSEGAIDATFTYTLTDTDGDFDTAVQPIEITDGAAPANPSPVTVTLDDQNLVDGSTPAAPEQDAGVLAFTEGSDAFESFAFATDLSTLGGNLTWTRLDGDTIIGEDNGRLVVTLQLTVSGNNATVTATLEDNYLGHSSQGDELDDLGFVNVIATDIDGDTATGRVDIDVSDDVPEASDYDGAAFDEGSGAHVIGDAATLLGIDGNADGLDGPLQDIVFTATTGFGGSLAINDAGELVYTSPANVASLDTVTESFTYTVTDNDGDTVTRTVTFDVRDTGVSEVQASDALVDEDSISGAGGNPGGPGDDAEVATGTITYSLGADALASVTLSIASTGLTTLDGTPVLTSWDAATNTLTGYAEGDTSDVVFTIALSDITATGATYTVVLQQPVQHPLQHDPSTNPDVELAFEDNLSLTVDVVVRDADGSEDASSFVVSIDDDTPVAGDDVSAEDVSEGGSTGGNVPGDDTAGADGYADEGPIVQVRTLDGTTVDATPDGDGNYVVSTALGTLTLNQNGTYTYESNPNSTNSDTSDVFIYTIRDADGDEAEAQLSIGIDNVAGDVSDNDVLVNEAGLPDGSDADAPSEVDADGQITVLNATGPFTFSLVGGVFDDGGTPDASDDTYTINGTYGTIVLNASTGSYTYTLDTPFTDSVDENGTNTVLAAESFEYEVRDAANNLITDPLADNFIVVDIIDDIPTAADETLVSVAEDLVGTVGGNVMVNDTEGADGATVTALTVGVETVDVPQDGSTAELVTVNGTYTIDYLGNWTFDPNPGLDQSSGAIIADFSYTLTDTDGDFDTATQPIRITDGAGPEDPTPIILDVDDQNLADGSTPNAPETDAATLNFVEGSDPYASFVFGDTSGLLGGLTWTRVDDTTITGEDGGRLVVTLTLSVSGNDATVTATLNDNYLGHSSQGDELDVLGSVDVIATDIDGDQAVGGVLVRVSDDVPTLTANAPTADSLTVDDDDFGFNATADFSGLFVPDYNADGAGDVSGYTLGFTSTATGLVDTLTNTAVTLVEVGDTIEGQNGNGDTVFVISVDANGTVTFDQQRAVIHDDTSDHNDAEPVPAWAANLITLSATVTDGDGDTAGATANIGGAFQILDDGPSVSAVLATGASVIVDETDLTAAAGTIDLGVTYTQGSDSDVSGSPTLVGQSSGANVLDVTVDFGNDQDVNGGGLTYSLTVGNGGASGVSTTSGTAITLVAVSDTVVVGVVNGTTTAAFAIEIDPSTGELSVEQYLSLQHDDPTDPDEADSPVTLAAGSLNAVVTAQDGDGDTDQSGAVDISGVIAFEDDGPTVTVTGAIPQLLVDESFLGTDATAEFGDVFTFAYGADGEALGGGESFLLGISAEGADSGLVDTATGNSVYLFLEGGVVVGREGTDALDAVGGEAVFTLTVDADGTVELDQIRAVVHNDPDNANEGAFLASDDLITLTARATDGDGDRGSATIDIGRDLEFRDDNPGAGNPITVLLDDDALTGGNPGGTGDDANSANTSGTLSFSFGADGGSIAFATTGAPSGFQYVASGSNILIQQDQGSGFVTVVTVTLNPTTGAYTVTQNLPVLHADGNAENNQVFNLTYVVTDGDGDTGATNGTLVINVDDDTPIANDVNSTGTVDEDGLSGIAGGDGDVAGEATLAQGSVTALFTAGADAPLTFGVNTVTAEAYLLSLDLTSGGADLEYLVSGNSITASADGNPVFNFFLAGNGDWQFELFGPLDHDDTSTEDDITIDFGPVVQASDADNDTIDAIGSVLVTIDDDSPIAVAPVAADVTNGPAPVEGPFLLDADGTLANNYGGDGAGTVRFSAALDGADSGMTSSFQTITYVLDDGQTLRGVTGFGTLNETTIFTVTLDPGSATYSVDMDGSIDSTSDVSFSPLTNNFVGGNNSWAGFLPLNEDENTAIDNDSQDLLLTPAINGNDSSTINSTANTGGVGGGASVGSGETFRVDFVTDLRGDPADGAGNYNTPGNRDHNFDGHYTVNGASALFKSTSGSTVNIAAYDDADGNTVVGDGTLDTITGVAITWRGTEWTGPNGESLITSTGVYTINGRQFTVTFNNDGTVNVAGVEGDNGSSQIGTEIAVFTDDGFNSVEYTWAGGQTFQIGGFGASTLSTDPVTFELPVEVVDGDGDVSDTANLSITANTPVSNAATLDSKASMMDAPVNDNDSFGAFSTKHVATQDPRFEARGIEMATVAAMASGLFLPHIHADLSQAFANTASAGRGMVNFEYAPIASIEAFQLPDGFGMGIEGLVGTGADLGAQFSMANILDSGAGFHAPQGAFAAAMEDPMAGFVAEPGAQVQLSGGPSVFEGFGGGDAASAMEALLMLEAPAKPAEGAAAQDAGMALGEAVADVDAEAQVDAIVDHFAAGDGLAIATTTTDGLLDSMLGSDMALYHAMGLPAQDQSDEAAALAAASA